MPRTPGPRDIDETPLTTTRDVVRVDRDVSIEATESAALAVREITNRIRDQQIETEIARADTQAAIDLEDVRRRYETDGDWETHEPRAMAEAQEILRRRGEGLRGSIARTAWEANSLRRVQTFRSAIRTQAFERGASQERANIRRLLDETLDIASALTLPENERRRVIENVAAAGDSAVRRGFLSEDDWAAWEISFGNTLRERRQKALAGEVELRLDQESEALVEQLSDPDGRYRELDDDVRAKFLSSARRGVAHRLLSDVYTEIARTGAVVPDDSERLAPVWAALGEDARYAYAQRASALAQAHALAGEIGDLSTRSLAEIVAAADANDGAGGRSGAARVVLRALRTDPAAVILRSDPVLENRRTRAFEAAQAAQAAPDDAAAQAQATQARRAYAAAMIDAQRARGLSSGEIRIHTSAQLDEWARRTRAMSAERQEAALAALPRQMLRMYGDDDIAERATLEHLDAYYAAAPGLTGARLVDEAQAPASAAAGADYESTKLQIERALRAGNEEAVVVLFQRLGPADQARLARDVDLGAIASE